LPRRFGLASAFAVAALLGGLELGGQKLDDLPLKHARPKAWPPAARPATIRRSISMKLTSREGTVTN
jgi:hypothetical protein